MARDQLAEAIADLERAEEQLRPYVRSATLLRAALEDAGLLAGGDPSDRAAELLLALRRLRLPGPRPVDAAALAVAQAVSKLEALFQRDTSPGFEARRRAGEVG